ncbi:SGNH/GDSL hydrolase family protein [Neobacillus ginsengisoli]|uniref:Lysophospholipase L1-like esterase n=1 Tax=Neobacillus ginsengisoli TaxID=904295 RepID=A0ABT9XSC6_9BACI|nr:GDSL-type esterase/lipase family protein [Neobacillus ginsengisoli]MDQ0197849.1 lysophospholipase L1-like esterase [Neobacillus ginsengisoli]
MSYSYVALGDSLSAGVGSSIFSPGFVHRFRRMAERELEDHVLVHVFARPGAETKDVLNDLHQDFIKEKVREADIITITAGTNDLIIAVRKYQTDNDLQALKKSFHECKENFSAIMNLIHELKKSDIRPFVIRLFHLYNPFPKEDLAIKWVKHFNHHLKGLAKDYHVSIVEINKVFNEYEAEYLSIDRIHPNDIGHEQMAERLHRLGYGELTFEEEE